MSKIESLRALLIDELHELYDAERRLMRALPRMVNAATNPDLRATIDAQWLASETHLARLEQALEELDEPTRRTVCTGAQGLIDQCHEHLAREFASAGLRDAAILAGMQCVGHYEIGAYTGAIAHARLLELHAVGALLIQTLSEERAASVHQAELAQRTVNVEAAEPDRHASLTPVGATRSPLVTRH